MYAILDKSVRKRVPWQRIKWGDSQMKSGGHRIMLPTALVTHHFCFFVCFWDESSLHIRLLWCGTVWVLKRATLRCLEVTLMNPHCIVGGLQLQQQLFVTRVGFSFCASSGASCDYIFGCVTCTRGFLQIIFRPTLNAPLFSRNVDDVT